MTSETRAECPHCQWWARKDRPPETFRFVTWEWDVDAASKLTPVQQGETAVAKWASCVDYPQDEGINLFASPVVEQHLDHVPLDKPLLFGLLEVEGRESAILIDGHHRLARAIRDGVERLPYRLLSAKQLLSCAVARPPQKRGRKNPRRRDGT